FANGGGITSSIVLNNTSRSSPAICTVSFFDDLGTSIPPESLTAGNLAAGINVPSPLGKVTIPTLGNGNLVEGSIRLSCNATVRGFVRFSIPGIGIAGTGDSPPATEMLIPVSQNPAGVGSGIAFQNIDDVPVTVVLTLYDSNGAS